MHRIMGFRWYRFAQSPQSAELRQIHPPPPAYFRCIHHLREKGSGKGHLSKSVHLEHIGESPICRFQHSSSKYQARHVLPISPLPNYRIYVIYQNKLLPNQRFPAKPSQVVIKDITSGASMNNIVV